MILLFKKRLGEIYTDKEIRKLDPEDEEIPTMKQLLTKEPLASISIKEFEEISRAMQKNGSNQDFR